MSNIRTAHANSRFPEAQNGRVMITLIQDQFARILLLPFSPLQNGRMARDFIRDELNRGFCKNQCQQ